MNPYDAHPHASAPPPWSSAPPPPYVYAPPPAPPPPAARAGAGVAGTIVVLLAFGATVLALVNLLQLTGFAEHDDRLPEWIQAIMFNGSLARVRWWGGGATVLGLGALGLGLLGRRATIGKVAIALSSLGLVGSLFAQVTSAMYSYRPETRPSERAEAPAAPAAAPMRDDGPMSPSDSTQQAAFRLGNKFAAAMFGRANGADPRAVAGVLGKARLAASELGAAVPEPGPLTGKSSEDNAEALHWLLGDAGKPIWRQLEKRYDTRHGALFELGIKLEVLRLMQADPEMRKGSIDSIKRLAAKGGVLAEVLDVATLPIDASADDVSKAIDASIAALDKDLGREKSVAAKGVAPKPAPAAAKPRAAAASKPAAFKPAAKRTSGRISDADRYVVTVTR